MTFCMFVDCMYYVLRAPRKIGAKPIGLSSLNKVFTYLLTNVEQSDGGPSSLATGPHILYASFCFIIDDTQTNLFLF